MEPDECDSRPHPEALLEPQGGCGKEYGQNGMARTRLVCIPESKHSGEMFLSMLYMYHISQWTKLMRRPQPIKGSSRRALAVGVPQST